MVSLLALGAVFRVLATLCGERLAQIEHLMLAFGQEVVEHLDKNEAAADGEVTATTAMSGSSDEPPVRSLAADAMPAEDSPFTDAPAPAKPVGDEQK